MVGVTVLVVIPGILVPSEVVVGLPVLVLISGVVVI